MNIVNRLNMHWACIVSVNFNFIPVTLFCQLDALIFEIIQFIATRIQIR